MKRNKHKYAFSGKQRAVVFVKNNLVELRKVVFKKLTPGQVRVKVEMSGICGSESRAITGQKKGVNAIRVKSGIILGHEGVGRLVEVDKTVKGFSVGDRVAILAHIPCHKCDSCVLGVTNRCYALEHIGFTCDGSAADYVSLPATAPTLVKIPKRYMAELAVLTEPLSCVLHGLHNLTKGNLKYLKNKTVLVLGSGPIGMIWSIFTLWLGANKVIIVDPNKDPDTVLQAVPKKYQTQTEVLSSLHLYKKIGSVDVAVIANSDPNSFLGIEQVIKNNGRVMCFAGLNGYSPRHQPKGTYGFNLNKQDLIKINPKLVSQVHYKEFVHKLAVKGAKNFFLFGSSGYTKKDVANLFALVKRNKVLKHIFLGMVTHKLFFADAALVYSHFGKSVKLSHGEYAANKSIKVMITR